MYKQMTRILFFLLALLPAMGLYAYDFQYGDLYYNIKGDSEVAVTSGDYSELISANIPASVTYNEVTYRVTSIENGAFSDCKRLSSIKISENIISIGTNALEGCIGLTSVTWNTETHEEYSSSESPFYNYFPEWYDCEDSSEPAGCQKWVCNFDLRSQITSFVFGDKVRHIPAYLCYGMKNLTSITIPESVTSIGRNAFGNCTGLPSVTIPNSVTSIGYNAFEGCTSLTSIIWNAKSHEDFSFSYDTWYGYKISNNPFFDIRSQIKSFIFGDSVVTIPAYICYGMDSLTSINFGRNITKIGGDALKGCSSLQSVYWNIAADSVVSPFYNGSFYLGLFDFNLNPQITSFTFGDEVVNIPSSLCQGMTKLPSITIGKNVQKIGSEAFSGCDSLKSVHYQGTLSNWLDIDFEGYSDYDYSDCRDKGANPLEYADSLFIGNSYVTDITIPEGVTTIKRCAFYKYAGLQSVKLPNSLKEIGDGAFYGCTSLTSPLSLPNVTSIGKWAFRSTGIQGTLNIPHSVDSIGDEAFRYCEGIDTLIIGNGIADIDDQFEDCGGITYLQLGSGVKTIAHNAFYDAKKLKRIVCYAIEPPVAQVQDGWSNGSFYNYNIHVQVPCDNLEDYETDAVWGSFKYLECVGAEKAETNGKVLVTPRDNDADITWPTNSNADTYTILIMHDCSEICPLVFNSDGQLTRIAFAAPARNGEQRHTPAALLTQDGYRFTVTGLSSSTQYAYAIDVKDAKDNVLNTYKGSFTTTGGATGMDDVPATGETLDDTTPRKVFRDGQVYILRGDKTYTIMGQDLPKPL